MKRKMLILILVNNWRFKTVPDFMASDTDDNWNILTSNLSTLDTVLCGLKIINEN